MAHNWKAWNSITMHGKMNVKVIHLPKHALTHPGIDSLTDIHSR